MRLLLVCLLLLAAPSFSQGRPAAKHSSTAASSSWFGETKGIVGLYASPSPEASVLNVYQKGTLVLVTQTSHGYGHVYFSEDNQGWMPVKALKRMTAAEVRAYIKRFVKAHPEAVRNMENQQQTNPGGP